VPFLRVPDFLANFLRRLAHARRCPGFVHGNDDGRNRSTIHAGKGNEFAPAVSHGYHDRFLHLLRVFYDKIDGALRFGVVNGWNGSHAVLYSGDFTTLKCRNACGLRKQHIEQK